MDKYQYIVQKLFSARFWMALAFSCTACAGFLLKILTPAEFMTLAGVVTHAYFSKEKTTDEPSGKI